MNGAAIDAIISRRAFCFVSGSAPVDSFVYNSNVTGLAPRNDEQ